MKPMLRALAFLLFASLAGNSLAQVRIKDIATIQGMRDNQLVGYGLIVGLSGSGDTMRNAPFTENSIRAMLDRMGVGPGEQALRIKNVAAVIVTATLPAYANPGGQIDVAVSSIGDASSLQGGTLIATPLYGADGVIYAVAQGSLVVSGFAASGEAAQVTSSTPTAARIPNGAIVERQAPGNLEDEELLVVELNNPDFNTVIGVTDAINAFTAQRFGKRLAVERDHRSVSVNRPPHITMARFFADIGSLMVTPDTPARIVVDERTGTVVIGAEVRVSAVAVTHGDLTVSVTETPEIVQPGPFSNGVTGIQPNTSIDVVEGGGALTIVSGPTLKDLVDGLNMMGARPIDIIAILQAIKSAGAIHATLVVQ